MFKGAIRSIFYDGGDYLIKNIDGIDEKMSVPNVSEKSHYTGLYVKLFSDFAEDFEKKNFRKNGLEEVYNSIYFLDKCYESAQERKTIELNNE
ncbi:hypothetical protein LLG34_01095 [bacterium]|nr:hypothetical protein [bacterium]